VGLKRTQVPQPTSRRILTWLLDAAGPPRTMVRSPPVRGLASSSSSSHGRRCSLPTSLRHPIVDGIQRGAENRMHENTTRSSRLRTARRTREFRRGFGDSDEAALYCFPGVLPVGELRRESRWDGRPSGPSLVRVQFCTWARPNVLCRPASASLATQRKITSSPSKKQITS
jgi:hypothetical protein